MFCSDKLYVVFSCPVNAALEDNGEKYAGNIKDGFKSFVSELYLVINAVCGVADRFERLLTHGQELGADAGLAVEPEVLAVAIAVVNGKVGEVLAANTVYDCVAVLLLHQYAVNLQNEVSTELGSDAVEIMVGRLIAIEFAGLVVLCVVKSADPCAFDCLNCIGKHHGAGFTGLFFNLTLLQFELALGHFVLGLVSGPAEFYALFEGLGLVVNEVNGALAIAQDILSGVGGVAAAKEHCVIILAGNIVGLNEGVRTEGGAAILAQSADNYSGHGEEEGSLIEIVYYAQIFKTGHIHYSLKRVIA